jgi:DnaJ-class molecular chaperone
VVSVADGKKVCPECGGSGSAKESNLPCLKCGGKGVV